MKLLALKPLTGGDERVTAAADDADGVKVDRVAGARDKCRARRGNLVRGAVAKVEIEDRTPAGVALEEQIAVDGERIDGPVAEVDGSRR